MPIRTGRAALALASLLLLAACGPKPMAVSAGGPELAAEWWQWAMAFPDRNNPVLDKTGVHCAVGQQGDVWFLAGGFGSSRISRTCTIPAGRALFFPLVNNAFWPKRPHYRRPSCDEARLDAALVNGHALDVFAEIDGIPVSGVENFRVASEACFDMFARVPPSVGFDAYPAATDGFWLRIDHLPPGRHTLRFGGRYDRSSPAFGGMVQDIEYALIVE